MASILSTTSSAINVGCYALLNDDYVAAKVPNLRWVLASHAPTRSTIADVNQWVGCSSPLPTVGVKPHSQFNHQSATEALKQQVTTFGAIRTSATIKTSKCSYKVALKHAALCKTLTAAFATNHAQGREWLSLDTNQSSDWVPTTESPMDALEAEDTTTTSLKEIYSKLTHSQTQIAELLLDGKTQSEIATILGIAQSNVCRSIKRMQGALTSKR